MSRPQSIDAYLDALAARLYLPPARLRRVLAETEDHLLSAARALQDSGLSAEAAECEAVLRFGPVDQIARGFQRARPPAWTALARSALHALLGFTVVGLVAIGASGLLSLAFGLAAGKSFVAGNPPGVTYTAARCADFLEYYPHEPDCDSAAVAHHFDEVVSYRLASGVLGLLAGVAWFLSRRLLHPRDLPVALVHTAGSAVFGLAAAGFTAIGGFQAVMQPDSGGGAFLSAGLVSGVVALAYASRLLPLLSTAIAGD